MPFMRPHRILTQLLALGALTLSSPTIHAQGTPDIPEPPKPPPSSTPAPAPEDEVPPFEGDADREGEPAPAAPPKAEPAAAEVAPVPEKRRSHHRLAPSLTGESGLLRVASAESAPARSIRLGLGIDFFSAGGMFREDDSQSRVGGMLAISVAPIEHLELWLNTRAQSSRSSLTRPELLQSLGDISLGLKGSYNIGGGAFTAGADAQITLLTGVGTQSFDFGASQFQIRALGTADLSRTSLDVPVQMHLNFGGIIDASKNLVEDVLSDAERFAHGSSEFDRLLFGFAIEVPVKYVTPYLEYTTEIPLGYLATPGIVLIGADRSALRTAQTAQEESLATTLARPPLQRVMPQRLTPGVRVTAVPDLTLDFAIEIGLTPDHGPGVVSVPPYNVIFLFSYALDPFAERGSSGPPIAVPVLVPEPTEPEPASGLVTGVVMNSADGKAIEDVVVTFDRAPPVATANNGRFLSHEIEPGPVKITAKKEGFEPTTADLEVAVGQTQELKLTMVPAIKNGTVRGKVTDAQGRGVANATVEVRGAGEGRATTDASGAFTHEVGEGGSVLVVDAAGFYRTGKKVEVEKGKAMDVEIRLKPRSDPPIAEVAGGQIRLKKKIGFTKDNALTPQSQEILDAVADLMWARPELKVKVEAHTDNSASEADSARKTQAQAEAVTGYLASQGIESARMTPVGVGSDRPIAPNMTQRGRDQNKRIELHVAE
jgi:OmpA-OmpF porin, OOP family